jgi:hypothetical protein
VSPPSYRGGVTLRRGWQVVRAGSIVLVIAAIAVALQSTRDAGTFNPTRFFAYFTIQSNLIGVAAFAWLLARGDRPRSRALDLLRGAAAVYLTITFFVVIFLLSDVDVSLDLAWVDVVLHKIFPIIVVADWLIDPPGIRLTPRDIPYWLVYPIIWAILTVIRGALDGWYPYPFLDPANGGYGQVAVTIVAITIGFVVVSLVIMALGNVRSGRRAARPLESSPA